jgi:hypothetical protein
MGVRQRLDSITADIYGHLIAGIGSVRSTVVPR